MISLTGLQFGPSFSLCSLTIAFGKPSATDPPRRNLVVPWDELHQSPTIFSMLNWRTRTSEFKGRQDELDELRLWTADNREISVKFITGPGGVGKTRLAAEFATKMQDENWAAGFVDLRARQTYQGNPAGTLLIVDYPEEDRPAVKELFKDLAKLQIETKLRVLFLTRQEIAGWRELVQSTHVETRVDPQPLPLVGLDEDAAHDVYLSASRNIGDALYADQKPVEQETFFAWLKEASENELALFIMAAAAYNALEPEDALVAYKGPEIIQSLIERETARLREIAAGCDVTDRYFFAKLIAMATIAGGIPEDKLDELVVQLDLRNKLPNQFDATVAFKNAGLIVDHRMPALKPDIVAAAFVVHVLRQKPAIAPDLIWLALHEDINGGIQRLARLSYDAEVVIGLHQYRLSHWFAEAVRGNIERARILELVASNDRLPMGLLDVAITTWQTLLPVTEKQSEKARILNNLSVDLASFGDQKRAIDAVIEAVEIYERLAAANPEAFEPALAMSYGALGNTYRIFDEYEKSATAFKYGVSALKGLFLNTPAAFGSLMVVLVRYYLETSKKIDATPDETLLSEIIELLQKFQGDKTKGSDLHI